MANRQDRRGRSKFSGQFIQLHHWMLRTEAWRVLKPAERAFYLEVAVRFNGSNNGMIALSARDAARLTHVNKDTATKAARRLVEVGLIECATPGGFSRKNPHATEWRLTHLRCDLTGALPTKAFVYWRPPTQNAVPIQGQNGPNPRTVDGLIRGILDRTVLDAGP